MARFLLSFAVATKSISYPKEKIHHEADSKGLEKGQKRKSKLFSKKAGQKRRRLV
jgi:hypothetical protein